MASIKRVYGKEVDYIRAIEIHKISKKFHIHLVLIFKELPQIKKSDIQKFWKHGNIDIKKVYDIRGLLSYLTLFKSCIRQKDSNLLYFPKGAKIIASTVKCEYEERELTISQKEYDWLEECGKDKCIRRNGHFYNENGQRMFCEHARYYEMGKDYVINNLGTKEDDEILNAMQKQ